MTSFSVKRMKRINRTSKIERQLTWLRLDRASPRPGGTPDNSPPFQRWVATHAPDQSRRDGRTNRPKSRNDHNPKLQHPQILGHRFAFKAQVLSSLTGLRASGHSHPPMNRWAIIFRPPGLESSAPESIHRTKLNAYSGQGRGWVKQWLPDMDLNHDKQIQSLLCYRYTIGQTSASKVGFPPSESRIDP